MNLGVALRGIGRPFEAAKEFEAALRIKPDFVEAHFNLGFTYLELGKDELALRELEAGLKLRPGDVSARRALEELRGH